MVIFSHNSNLFRPQHVCMASYDRLNIRPSAPHIPCLKTTHPSHWTKNTPSSALHTHQVLYAFLKSIEQTCNKLTTIPDCLQTCIYPLSQTRLNIPCSISLLSFKSFDLSQSTFDVHEPWRPLLDDTTLHCHKHHLILVKTTNSSPNSASILLKKLCRPITASKPS